MKKNTIKEVQKRTSVFDQKSWLCFSLVVVFLLTTSIGQAQEIRKTFTKEIAVSPGATISSNGPLSMDFEMHGRIDMDWNDKFYQIIPGGNDGVSALLVRDYEIFTWDKNTIKQEVEITIVPADDAPSEGKMLMEKLTQSLVENANGTIVIDDNLNIQKFGFTNGFLKKNTNKVTLEDGQSFRMKGITIKSTLHIPKASNLELSTKYLAISLGDLDGKLKLDLFRGEISAGNIKEMDANLDFCKASFKQLGKVVLNAKKTTFVAESIDDLQVGSNDLAGQALYKCNLSGRGAKSSLSKYSINSVKEIEIRETTNDNFSIAKLGTMRANYSTFSNYEIGQVNESIYLNAKNGDLRIDEVAEGFSKVEVDNHISSVYLNVKDNPNYKIQLQKCEFTELNFSDGIKQLQQGNGKVYLKGREDLAGKVNISCDSCKINIED